MSKVIRLLQLYPRDMNIYGDWGNTLTLMRRLEWRGYKVELLEYNPGDTFPQDVDLIVGGGGQDSGQNRIQQDLKKVGPTLQRLANDGVPMLMICGLYQLFGKFFKTRQGEVIEGIGLFDIETYGGDTRMIGNIVTTSESFGDIIGYENHSGVTMLGEAAQPFGTVRRGAGNNGKDGTEGAMYKNVIGTYLHGSLLPKNPLVADWLIDKAVVRKYAQYTAGPINSLFDATARKIAATRPR